MSKIIDFEWYNDNGMSLSIEEIGNLDINSYLRESSTHIDGFTYNSHENTHPTVGVRWKYGNKIIDINNVLLCSKPIPSMEKVIVVMNDEYHSSTIYNADGDIHLKLDYLCRVAPYVGKFHDSPTFLNNIIWINKEIADYWNINIQTIQDGFSVIVELNGICDDCYEYRLFNPETGTLGMCLYYGCH